jgi:hypothetical protein
MNTLTLFCQKNKSKLIQTFYIGLAVGAILMCYLLITEKFS